MPDEPHLGLRRIAEPLGVIAVASPGTAPAPGIVCNVLPMLKTRNAAVFSPNPRALGRRCAWCGLHMPNETADAADAAEKIVTGTGYNNGTSCSSENNVLVHSALLDPFPRPTRGPGSPLGQRGGDLPAARGALVR